MMSAPRLAGRAIAGAALTCMAVLATACGAASGPSATPAKTVTVTATPAGPASTSAATPVAATPAAATSPAAPAGPAACPTRYLGVKAGLSQGTVRSTYAVIDFRNIGNVTCTVYGYPGVSLGGGSPVRQIGLAAAENPATPRRLVTLAPGAVANALVTIVHTARFSAAKCGPSMAAYLVIIPPGQSTPIYLAYTTSTCSKPVQILTVNVLVPGSGG